MNNVTRLTWAFVLPDKGMSTWTDMKTMKLHHLYPWCTVFRSMSSLWSTNWSTLLPRVQQTGPGNGDPQFQVDQGSLVWSVTEFQELQNLPKQTGFVKAEPNSPGVKTHLISYWIQPLVSMCDPQLSRAMCPVKVLWIWYKQFHINSSCVPDWCQ